MTGSPGFTAFHRLLDLAPQVLNRVEVRRIWWEVPDIAIAGSSERIELPVYGEGFDELFYVRLDDGQFSVEKWKA
jgi:hypothetical protein